MSNSQWAIPALKLHFVSFASFAAVGTLGFLVDAAVLLAALAFFDWGPYWSRLLSFLVAITVTWAANRFFTFRSAAKTNKAKQYGAYFVVQTIGAAINFGVYSLLIAFSSLFLDLPVLALAIGSLTAMLFNYVGARTFVFKPNEAG